MTDDPDDGAAETPMQRALRLKKEARDRKPAPPSAGKFPRDQAGDLAAGKSKPWMKR